jgi:ClpP class serine protease
LNFVIEVKYRQLFVMTSINDFLNLIFIIILLQAFIPLIQQKMQGVKRLTAIRDFEKKRKTRVITMIHRQETLSFLGIPISRYIDIEDSEKILRAIRLTSSNVPIDLIIHTPGGLVLAAEQIAFALKRHKGKITIFVPHYAMSGGTLLALSADEVIMDRDAVLGPVDPQLSSSPNEAYPAASILEALKVPNQNREDSTLILGDVAKKAIKQVHDAVYFLVKGRMSVQKAKKLAYELSRGKWTHDYAITFDEAKKMGMPVSAKMPREVYEIMDLYPQPLRSRGGVEFIPIPYRNKKQTEG